MMVVKDNRCYSSDLRPVLKITGAESLGSYRLRVVFNGEETRIFDGRSLLQTEVFAPLADEKVFADYRLDYETLTWLDGDADIAPEFVYEHSEPIEA